MRKTSSLRVVVATTTLALLIPPGAAFAGRGGGAAPLAAGQFLGLLFGQRLDVRARVRALAAYKDFLTLWKDADPGIPILKEARAEYAILP